MTKKADLTGGRYGLLTVIRESESKNGRAYWECLCDCGKTTLVSSGNLKTNAVKSCGCLQGKKNTHHLSNTRLYRIWNAIKVRCCDQNHHAYKYYGGKGITVCREWQNDFLAFYDWAIKNGYKEDLTIDRIDNQKGYEPGNCRFVDRKVQANNRAFCRTITYDGRTQNLMQWCEELGLKYKLIHSRISVLGWSFEKAISTPVKSPKEKETNKNGV